jgi:hypothetical protein
LAAVRMRHGKRERHGLSRISQNRPRPSPSVGV